MSDSPAKLSRYRVNHSPDPSGNTRRSDVGSELIVSAATPLSEFESCVSVLRNRGYHFEYAGDEYHDVHQDYDDPASDDGVIADEDGVIADEDGSSTGVKIFAFADESPGFSRDFVVAVGDQAFLAAAGAYLDQYPGGCKVGILIAPDRTLSAGAETEIHSRCPPFDVVIDETQTRSFNSDRVTNAIDMLFAKFYRRGLVAVDFTDIRRCLTAGHVAVLDLWPLTSGQDAAPVIRRLLSDLRERIGPGKRIAAIHSVVFCGEYDSVLDAHRVVGKTITDYLGSEICDDILCDCDDAEDFAIGICLVAKD